MNTPPNLPALRKSDALCKPLTSRIYTGSSRVPTAEQSNPLSLSVPCRNAEPITLQAPLFLRAGADSALPTSFLVRLQSTAREFGIPFLAKQVADDGTVSLGMGPQHMRIVPLEYDRPLVAEELRGACGAEMQLFGSPYLMDHSRSRTSSWTPALPIELRSFETLSKKVELVRVLLGGNGLVGAAIVPGMVYDDVRLIIDSNFDYVTLLSHVTYGFDDGQSLALHDSATVLHEAVRARRDAGKPNFPLFFAAASTSGSEIVEWIARGATAVCVDRAIVSQRPAATTSTPDSFSTFLGGYTAPVAANYQWIAPAMKSLVEQIDDRLVYLGYASLREFREFVEQSRDS